jgi:predicted small secreted protein
MSFVFARPMISASLLLLLLATGLAVSACHTMEGLGQDMSEVGNKLSTKAQEHTGQ